MQLLIVEDQPKDLRLAASAAQESGFSSIEARTSMSAAREYLEKGLAGAHPLPDAIVLDLDLGYESGFELLRFWYGNPQLVKIPLVIWTILGDQYRQVCEMFKVSSYVDKAEGAAALRKALSGMASMAS
ncbi:MAG TPA: response regulator [Acidobacteriaceae bacterium]|nr:response regulator [Acidobacteriaceae bacterium]